MSIVDFDGHLSCEVAHCWRVTADCAFRAKLGIAVEPEVARRSRLEPVNKSP